LVDQNPESLEVIKQRLDGVQYTLLKA